MKWNLKGHLRKMMDEIYKKKEQEAIDAGWTIVKHDDKWLVTERIDKDGYLSKWSYNKEIEKMWVESWNPNARIATREDIFSDAE